MSGVAGAFLIQVIRGFGLTPNGIDQKENLLKILNKKNMYKINRRISRPTD